MRNLCYVGLRYDNGAANRTVSSFGLTYCGAGRRNCLVGYGGMRYGRQGIVFDLATLTGSFLEAESGASRLADGFPLGEAMLVRLAARGHRNKSKSDNEYQHRNN